MPSPSEILKGARIDLVEYAGLPPMPVHRRHHQMNISEDAGIIVSSRR